MMRKSLFSKGHKIVDDEHILQPLLVIRRNEKIILYLLFDVLSIFPTSS